jgi:hypothetical protein
LAIDEETNIKIIDLYFNQPKTIPDIVKIFRKSSRDVNVSKVYRKQETNRSAKKMKPRRKNTHQISPMIGYNKKIRHLIYLLDN